MHLSKHVKELHRVAQKSGGSLELNADSVDRIVKLHLRVMQVMLDDVNDVTFVYGHVSQKIFLS